MDCGLAASESPPEAGTLAQLNVYNPASCMYFCSVSFNSSALQILVQFQSEIPFVSISTNAVVECHNYISHEGESAAWFALKLK